MGDIGQLVGKAVNGTDVIPKWDKTVELFGDRAIIVYPQSLGDPGTGNEAVDGQGDKYRQVSSNGQSMLLDGLLGSHRCVDQTVSAAAAEPAAAARLGCVVTHGSCRQSEPGSALQCRIQDRTVMGICGCAAVLVHPLLALLCWHLPAQGAGRCRLHRGCGGRPAKETANGPRQGECSF
jgi:hypothetical protein